MLTVKNLTIQYNKRIILENVNLTFRRGNVYVISGESGSGKSSLLNILGLIQNANQECSLEYDTQNLLQLSDKEKSDFIRNRIGFVFQHNNLLHALSVYDNLTVQLRSSTDDKRYIDAVVRELIDFVGLSTVAQSFPSDISGGEEQRVAIARALSMDQDIILADEPTSALDNVNRDNILALFKDIAHEKNKTVIIVSHDQEVIRHADVHMIIEGHAIRVVRSELRENDSECMTTDKYESSNKVKIAWSFVRFINSKRKKEKRIPKLILLMVSISVAITTLGILLSQKFTEIQNNNMVNITDKSLFVVNDTMGLGSQDVEENMSFSDVELKKLEALENVEVMIPYYELLGYGLTKDNVNEAQDTLLLSMQQVDDNLTFEIKENFAIQPLYPEDKKDHYILEKIPDYKETDVTISEDFLIKHRIPKASILGKHLSFKIYIPVKQFVSELRIKDGSEWVAQTYDGNIYSEKVIEFRVGAIFKSSFPFKRSSHGNSLFLDYHKLFEIIENTVKIQESNERTFPNFEEHELRPSAVYMIANSYKNLEKISSAAKLNVQAITTFSLAQNIKVINETVTLTKSVMLVVSTVFILLSTSILMFVFYLTNKSRKREVGIFKSIGVQKKNIIGIYLYELLMHSLTITSIAMIVSFAAICIVNTLVPINLSDFMIRSFLYAFLLSIGVTLASGIIPIMSATNSIPIDTIRNHK